MGRTIPWKRAVKEFVKEVKLLYGGNLHSIILYGSRARGEADEGSDIDLLIVLNDYKDFWQEFHKVEKIASELSFKHDLLISAIPIREGDYRERVSPLILNIKREGVIIA